MTGLADAKVDEALDAKLDDHAALPKSSVLSNRISKVLSASYADSDIRESLRILDRRNISNTIELRRNLKSNVQKEVIALNGDIVRDFGEVAEELKGIGNVIRSLKQCCESMRQHVAAAHVENKPVLEEVSVLLEQKEVLGRKKQVLEAFDNHFILSKDDLQHLVNISTPIDNKFFAILSRVKGIYRDCQVLLGSEDQRLGIELMEQTTKNLNSGYQKLYRWVQQAMKSLDLENPQINVVMRRALRSLAERPTLFRNCLDLFANAREQVLTNAFYAALTGSASVSEGLEANKPMEFHAHDSIRYIGDMLAWTHSTTVSEREALEAFFLSEEDELKRGLEAGREAEPWSETDGEGFNGQKALEELVGRNLAGVARALRQRIEQVLQNHDDAVVVYNVYHLIKFYVATFERLIGSTSSLMATFSTLLQSALHQFTAITSESVSGVQADPGTIPSSLGKPDFLEDALTQFAILAKSYESSLTPEKDPEEDFKLVVSQTLDPFLAACENLARDGPEPDSSIFLLNCCLAAQQILCPFDFVPTRLAETEGRVSSLSTRLVDYQHAFFLHTSGLYPLVSGLGSLTDTPEDLRRIPALIAFQPAALSDASQVLDEFLPSATMDAMEHVKKLASIKLAQEITAEAADRFCEDFDFVEGRLRACDELGETTEADDDDEVDTEGRTKTEPAVDRQTKLRDLFPRTSGEIRVLLS